MGRGESYEQSHLHGTFGSLLEEAGEYFMKRGRLHETLRRLAVNLDREGIAYALVGGMALGERGYVRMTEDVDVLLTAEGLERFHARLVGRGYMAAHPGARRTFRDTASGVRIEVLVTGEFPGDGKPKPVAFPHPEAVAENVEGLRVISLVALIELKLASGQSAPSRLRDLADVLELIQKNDLEDSFAESLDPSVRPKFLELVQASRS